MVQGGGDQELLQLGVQPHIDEPASKGNPREVAEAFLKKAAGILQIIVICPASGSEKSRGMTARRDEDGHAVITRSPSGLAPHGPNPWAARDRQLACDVEAMAAIQGEVPLLEDSK